MKTLDITDIELAVETCKNGSLSLKTFLISPSQYKAWQEAVHYDTTRIIKREQFDKQLKKLLE